MTDFPDHTRETAPASAQPTLDAAQKTYGMIPNLFRKMAEAPAALDGYWHLARAFDGSSFSPIEQQVVLIAASVRNECTYCVAVHSSLADMARAPEAVVEALRTGKPVPDARLEALRRFTEAVVDQRGWVPPETVQAFLDAGFNRGQVLEVILGVGLKTLSNYTNHLAQTELDDAFKARAWTPFRQ